MDHALPVGIAERRQHLQDDVADLVGFTPEVLRLEKRGERPPEHALHHQIDEITVLAGVVHGDDVRMLQATGRARFDGEPRQDGNRLAGIEPRLVDHLDRQRALDHRVVGLVDGRHGPGAEHAANLVFTDAFRERRHRV